MKISKQELLKLVLASVEDEVNIPFENFTISNEERSKIYSNHFMDESKKHSNDLKSMSGLDNLDYMGEIRDKDAFDEDMLAKYTEMESGLNTCGREIKAENHGIGLKPKNQIDDDIPQIPTSLNDDTDSYFDYYPIRDKRYLQVLKGKITYPEYLKQLDERYYYLLKSIEIINNIVGLKVLPRLDFKKYRELSTPYNILEYIRYYTKNNIDNKNEKFNFIKLIRPTAKHNHFKYDSYADRDSKAKNETSLIQAFAKFDEFFTPTGNEFADLIYVLEKFLLPEYLLFAILRPQALRNPRRVKYYDWTDENGNTVSELLSPKQDNKLVYNTSSPVKDFEYNLTNFRNSLKKEYESYPNRESDSEYMEYMRYINSISRELDNTYMEYKGNQLIELIMPNVRDLYAEYDQYKYARRKYRRDNEDSDLSDFDQIRL